MALSVSICGAHCECVLCFVAWPTRRRKWYTTCLCSAWNSVTVLMKRWDICALEWWNQFSSLWEYYLKWHRMEVGGQSFHFNAVGCEWWAGRYIVRPDPFYLKRKIVQCSNEPHKWLSRSLPHYHRLTFSGFFSFFHRFCCSGGFPHLGFWSKVLWFRLLTLPGQRTNFHLLLNTEVVGSRHGYLFAFVQFLSAGRFLVPRANSTS
jgi:hypothetical protein